MSVRGFKALEPHIRMLPCPTQQALFQLREKLKLQEFRNESDVKKFEPRSLIIEEKTFFPFQGEDYWLATEIKYKFESVQVLEVLNKNDFKQRHPQIENINR